MAELTPMMKQYRHLKQKSGDAVLFFRLGDFYEMFDDDAREVSALLNITLTKRNGTPMCGIPYHASHTYISRLLKAGKKIAVCEQISMPAGGKGIAQRDIVEIITPGTLLDEDFLDGKRNNFLAAIGVYKNSVSFSYTDSSTGEFFTTSFPYEQRKERIKEELGKIQPVELLVQESFLEEDEVLARIVDEREGVLINRYPDWSFDIQESYRKLTEELRVANLKGYGIDENDPALYTVNVIIDYLEETNRGKLPHIRTITLYHDTDYLGMDESTLKNLELFRNQHDGSIRYSLFEILDNTKTSMGGRKLRKWLSKPLIDMTKIKKRLDRVENLYRQQILLNSLRDMLKKVLDLERLSSRTTFNKAHAKDILGIGSSLRIIFSIDLMLREWDQEFPFQTAVNFIPLQNICGLIETSICDDPSVLLTEGNIIREGYSSRLDELKSLRKNSQKVLREYLEDEKKNTGIANLKIKYNKIIGHFLEVSKGNAELVPEHFIRRQSLVGTERFTTEKLGELESKLNNAAEQIVDLEKQLFLEIREQVKERISDILAAADFISELDCLCSFAYAATAHGYTKPKINNSERIQIIDGRHPVVEAHIAPGTFIPNSVNMDHEHRTFILLTGPNMAGKSTFLRQTALIVLMAQTGSFVPALEADIGLVDKIFCRVGASDNLSRGESTFLVEMNETAYILRSATRKSLVIMDEVGRGTATNDGLSIAWAVSEYLLDRVQAKTLFATHYHELTHLHHSRISNLYMDVAEKEGEILFLKQVKSGASKNSYGIQVAKLAGLPDQVVDRAGEVFSTLEEKPSAAEELQHARIPSKTEQQKQSELFDPIQLIEKELRHYDLQNKTPLEALNTIDSWKKLIDNDNT